MNTIRRLGNLRIMFFAVIVVLGLAYSLFGSAFDAVLSPACDHMPPMPAGIADAHAADLRLLQDRGLLYCPSTPPGVAGVGDRIYWGTDGVESVLYFLVEDPASVQITHYEYDSTYFVSALGDRPIAGFRTPGRPIYRNEAPEGVGYYFVKAGGPMDFYTEVDVTLRGPMEIPKGGGRNFFDDMTIALQAIRGRSATEGGTRQIKARIPVAVSRWQGVSDRWINPDLVSTERVGQENPLLDTEVAGPTLWQAATGPLGTGVWVVGVVTGTHPALVLTADDGSGARFEPLTTTIWTSGQVATAAALFALPPLPPEVRYQAAFSSSGPEGLAQPDALLGPFSFSDPEAATTP